MLPKERYRSLGPLGLLGPDHCYPKDMRPEPNADRYEQGDKPSEESFNLETPEPIRDTRQRLRQRLRDREESNRDLRIPRPPTPEIERLPPALEFQDSDFDN